MKKATVLFFFILFILPSFTYSQMYVKLGGGYNLDFNSVEFGTSTTSSISGSSYTAVYGSLGRGANFAGAFGYNFTSNIGGELSVMYKLSTDFEEKDQSGTSSSTTTYSGSFFAFAPTLVLNASTRSVKPFAKIGLLIAIPSADWEMVSTGSGSQKLTFSSGVDFGIVGGAGLLFPLSTNIDFFAEIDFVSLTWKPSEAEASSASGTQTIKFKDEFTSSDQYVSSPFFIPYSNVGLNVGILIGF